MSKINLVDIAIAGVQKAATSSLHIYIGQHPEIITHNEREFSFFVQDDEFKRGYENVYQNYFPEAEPTKKILIKNVGIVFWEDAMQRLQQHNPRVKIILVLRNPVERAYSAYWYAKLRSKENADTFEKALQASNGKSFDKESKAVSAYLERGNYSAQLKTLYKYFPSEHVKIILFDDLKENIQEVLTNVFEFCEINSSFNPAINKKLKGSSQSRVSWLANITNQQGTVKSNLRRLLPDNLRHGLRKKINEMNKKEFSPPQMKAETRQKLIEHYKPMMVELSDMIDRDLSDWIK